MLEAFITFVIAVVIGVWAGLIFISPILVFELAYRVRRLERERIRKEFQSHDIGHGHGH